MGLLHIYNTINDTHETLHANGKIKDIIPECKKTIVLKEGHRLDGEYEVTENDVIYVRKVPGSTSAIAVIAIVSAVVAVGVGVGAAIYTKKKQAELEDEYNEQQKRAKEKAEKINAFPFLKGTKNQSALGRTIPYIMGNMYFTPYMLNSGYYTISGTDGEKQYYNTILNLGYNNQKIQSISIGNTKILDLDITQDQTGARTVQHAVYGDIDLDIETEGEIYQNGLSQKVVGEAYGDEIKHDFGQDAEPLIKQLPENVQRVEVCLRYDGLREFDENTGTWNTRTVTVVPYWSNNADAETPVWHEFSFKNENNTEWLEMNSSEIAEAVSNGKLEKIRLMPPNYLYISNSGDVKVTGNPPNQTIYKRVGNNTNTIVRNTNRTIRFIAEHDFTAAESYGKNISIKLVRQNPKLENGNANETSILEYINTYCYDAIESTSELLVACRPLQNPFRDQTLRLGIRIAANESTSNVLDEINVMTYGTARTLSNGVLSENKEPTRNPVAWIIDLLTSNYHQPSMYSINELKLSTFQTAYSYCDANNYYCDYVVTQGTKKRDLIEKILATIGASLITGSEGLLEIAIDKAESTPVALLNSQSIKSITYAKTFQREITGLKTTYPDRNTWALRTAYFMRDGRTSYNQITDRLGELSLETVTTHEHAYKVAQRQQRQTILQPRTIKAEVGLEGELYPLYSTVLLQMEQLKQGIASTVLHDVIRNEQNQIIKLVVADKLEFVEDNRYGIILQVQNQFGKQLIYREVIGEGKTNVLELAEPYQDGAISPEYNNEISFGLLTEDGEFTKVTNVMKIYNISPSGEHGWTLELKDYNPAIYEFGTVPAYKSNLTTRPTTERNLPTITQSMLNASQMEANAYTRQVGEGLSARIDDIVTTVTVCALDTETAIYPVDSSGRALYDETTEINIDLRQGEEILDFTLGTLILPEGFTYTFENKKLTLHIAKGSKVQANTLRIPVVYKAIVSMSPYLDENGNAYVDGNGEPYCEIVYSNTSTTFPLYFTYFGNGGGQYVGSYSNVADIPQINNINDFIVWLGDTTESPLVKEGSFVKAVIYHYTGTDNVWRWEIDQDETHLALAFKMVLGANSSNLEQDNPKAYEYIQNLVANDIFANSIKARDGFFDNISIKGSIESDNFDPTSETNGYKFYKDGNLARGIVPMLESYQIKSTAPGKPVYFLELGLAARTVSTATSLTRYRNWEAIFSALGIGTKRNTTNGYIYCQGVIDGKSVQYLHVTKSSSGSFIMAYGYAGTTYNNVFEEFNYESVPTASVDIIF